MQDKNEPIYLTVEVDYDPGKEKLVVPDAVVAAYDVDDRHIASAPVREIEPNLSYRLTCADMVFTSFMRKLPWCRRKDIRLRVCEKARPLRNAFL